MASSTAAARRNNLDDLLLQLDDTVNDLMAQQDEEGSYDDVLGGYATLGRGALGAPGKGGSTNSRADSFLDLYGAEAPAVHVPTTLVEETVSETASVATEAVPEPVASRASITLSTRSLSHGVPRYPVIPVKNLEFLPPRTVEQVVINEHIKANKPLDWNLVYETDPRFDHKRRGSTASQQQWALSPPRRGSSSQQSQRSQDGSFSPRSPITPIMSPLVMNRASAVSTTSSSYRRREPALPAVPQNYGNAQHGQQDIQALRNQLEATQKAIQEKQAEINRQMLTQQTLSNTIPIMRQGSPIGYSSRRPSVAGVNTSSPPANDSWSAAGLSHMPQQTMPPPQQFSRMRSSQFSSRSRDSEGARPSSPAISESSWSGRVVGRSKSSHSLMSRRAAPQQAPSAEAKAKKQMKNLMEGGLL
ncbi:hypothetical protein BC830DRAFT_1166602 [Chytriomyces sp. MP71]|nr:hypothetical protein BC830DRAFT_1166602 [Chytriomyces sp. MP71]